MTDHGKALHVLVKDFWVGTLEVFDHVQTLVEGSEDVSDGCREQSVIRHSLELDRGGNS